MSAFSMAMGTLGYPATLNWICGGWRCRGTENPRNLNAPEQTRDHW